MMSKKQTVSPAKPFNSKEMPLWCKILFLSLPVIISFFQIRTLDNDFFFLYKMGEYIVHRGFPYTDVLSMHSSMKIVVQQWLSAVIYYFSYNTFGQFGVIGLVYICNTGIVILSYRFIKMITKNDLVSLALAGLINFFIFDPFMVTRPQVFTYLILLGTVCLLEKHVITKKSGYLFAIPVLSLALINLHAAMWPMILVFMLPYIVDSIPIKVENHKKEPNGNCMYLLASFAISIVMGLINPYGVENMLYLTKSYGHSSFNMIMEMKPTSTSATEGILFFTTIAITALITLFIKKRAVTVRFFLLYFGTLVLGIMQIKGIPYFFFFGLPAFAYMIKDLELSSITKYTQKIITNRIKVLLKIFFASAFVFLCVSRYNATNEAAIPVALHRHELDNIIAILNESEDPMIFLYANFNDGQYLEYYGFRPYIDGRAEVFLAENNQYYDVYEEYYCLFNGGIYYKSFLDKYGFNYIILDKEIDSYTYASVVRDPDFELLYDSYDVVLFRRTDWSLDKMGQMSEDTETAETVESTVPSET